jgi:hypothetical protein
MWRYPTAKRDLACVRATKPLARDDREALLERVLFASLPRRLPSATSLDSEREP